MWVLERFATRTPHKCAVVWMPNHPSGKGAATIAVFMGAAGERAATRIVDDLNAHAVPAPPEFWAAPEPERNGINQIRSL